MALLAQKSSPLNPCANPEGTGARVTGETVISCFLIAWLRFRWRTSNSPAAAMRMLRRRRRQQLSNDRHGRLHQRLEYLVVFRLIKLGVAAGCKHQLELRSAVISLLII